MIDLAVTACVRLGLGSPPTYGDAFRRLAQAGHVHEAASKGPGDLRAFLAVLRALGER